MTHLLRLLLTTYLSFTLIIVWPLVSQAEGRKRVILIPVADETDSKELPNLKTQIEQILGSSQKLSIVTSDLKGTGGVEVPGDVIYLDGERQFLNLEYENTLKTCDLALAQFAKNPGVQNGINKVWVLKAQVYLKQGKEADATRAFEKAIAAALFQKELDDYFYHQPIRVAYSRAYQDYISKTSTTELTIQVKGDKSVPVYLNGAKIGSGPQVQATVPVGSVQLAAAGDPAIVTRIEAQKKSMTVQLDKKEIKKSGSMNRIDDALSLGQSVNADLAVMMSLEKDQPNYKLGLRVVDVNARSATPLTRLEIENIRQDTDSAAAAAAHHILSVPEKKFAEIPGDKSKKKTPKALLYGVIGVLVVGAGVGAALGMGGGGGGSSTSTTTSVSGPAPEAP